MTQLDYDAIRGRSINLKAARDVVDALERLNGALGVEFDGALRRYDAKGNFGGIFWQDLVAEEWMYDPRGAEGDVW